MKELCELIELLFVFAGTAIFVIGCPLLLFWLIWWALSWALA